MKKAALHNLGCKVNAYETEAMQELLERAGYEIVPFKEGADIYIINTCTVTNVADRKSRQMLHRARKMNPGAVVVAAGCYVQTQEGQETDPCIDIVIGNNKKQDLITILREYDAVHSKKVAGEDMDSAVSRDKGSAVSGGMGNAADGAGDSTTVVGQAKEDPLTEEGVYSEVIDIGHVKEYEELSLSRTGEHTRAYIKVQDGCNQFCSYCIIPYARGRVRSRSRREIVEEVKRLQANGYQEVVLTGIHLSSYGIDYEGEENLLTLISSVHEVEGIQRIRLGSLEPRIITETFAAAIAILPKLCPHFHLSLQSGCDATLKRMNRRYTAGEYYEKCLLLRKYFENPALTTDVIVGFPGETETEFEESRAFVEKTGFYETHIFKYSKRQGTRAAAMDNQVPEQIKALRSDILLALNEKQRRRYEESFLGKEVEVLVEETAEIDGRTVQVGHTREYMKIALDIGGNLQNSIRKVQIDNDLQIIH